MSVSSHIQGFLKNSLWRKVTRNIGWLSLEHILRLMLGFVVSVLLARHLGPGEFGLLNYAIALVTLLLPIASVGLDSILVKQLVEDPDRRTEILGSGLILRLFGGLVAYALCLALVSVLRPGNGFILFVTSLLAANHLLRAFDIFKYWFESRVVSKPVVLVQSGFCILATLVKFWLILQDASLIAFVYVMLAECFCVSLGICAVYWKVFGAKDCICIRWGRIKGLLRQSWPLMLSGIAIFLYMRLDKIMLGQMVGDHEVGVYAAASGLSEAWNFLPMIVLASLFPPILRLKVNAPEQYAQRFQWLMRGGVFFGLAVAFTISMIADLLIEVLYGTSYQGASVVLMVHTWAFPFVILGIIGGRWYIAENLEKIIFYRTVSGAVVNVILNYFLIPSHGAVGAAVATVISQLFAGVLFNYVNSRTRTLFYMQIGALSPMSLFRRK